MVIEVILTMVSLGSLIIASRALSRVRALEAQLAHPVPPTPLPATPEFVEAPLAGLVVALDVQQDHPVAPWSQLLKEDLLKAGVAEMVEPPSESDLTITGHIVCNGYSDVYFEADLQVSTRSGVLLRLIEKPPHGDRPNNLAIELVDRINKELGKRSTREERKAALRELGTG